MSSELQRNDPEALYRRWEDSQWSPFAVDLRTDRGQWPELGDEQRGLIYFVLASLMVAEERITTKFSGLVAAGGSEEEVTFLATQQVDEARHMQFYARYQDEVVASAAEIGAHVDRSRGSVSDAFRQIFDVALVRAHEELLAAPSELAAKVRFVTLYHQVLEGTLGHVAESLKLPGDGDASSLLDASDDDLRQFALGGLTRRLQIIDVPLETVFT